MNTLILQDFAVVPALYDDFGHYLLLENPYCFSVEKALPGWKNKIMTSEKRLLSFVEIVDRKLGIYSMIDQMIMEGGKYRCYLCPNRVTAHAPLDIRSELESFCARSALFTLRKYGLGSKVHTDYLWVGNIRYKLDERKRNLDIISIKKTRAIISGSNYLKPNERFLPVNPKIEYSSPYFELPDEKKKEKEAIANELREVSLIWQCGLTRRQRLRDQQIYTFDNPHFESILSQYLPSSKFTIVQKMLRLFFSPHEFDFPERNRLQDLYAEFFSLPLDSFLFVDFETDYQKCIYLFGYSQGVNGYKSEWADDLCPEKEIELMHRIIEIVTEHKNRGGKIIYYFAEDMFWRQRCKFHQLHEFSHLFSDGIDLYQIFEKGPILIKGVFNFKLKSIAKALFEKGHIPISQPEGCSNGAESINIAKRYFNSRQEKDKTILENYNKFDCDVLMEITKFIFLKFL